MSLSIRVPGSQRGRGAPCSAPPNVNYKKWRQDPAHINGIVEY